jgi:MoxR-like ATPase
MPNKRLDAPADEALRQTLRRIEEQLGSVILGKTAALRLVLTAFIGGGHVLMEDLPGVGKTTLAKTLARCLSVEYRRVQFTPDLLPTDILGSSVFNPRDGSFTFKPGPIFTQVLLADEINRASPRTQSALLEAMSERQVSIEGTTRSLPRPFLVLATQNPIEFHGTYPLPEAQLDRFAMRVNIGYPQREREIDVLFVQRRHHPLKDVRPVADAESILALQERVRAVRVERRLGAYIVDLAHASRVHASLRMGCSPRGALMLFRMAQARAFIESRDYVIPEDVKATAVPTLAHRLGLDTRAKYSGRSKDDIVREILDQVSVGV